MSGGSTIIVSLPKEWVDRVELKRLDEVLLVPQPDGSLYILPRKPHPEETVIQVSARDMPDVILRQYISRYLAGFSTIRIKFQKNAPELAQSIKEQARRMLIGVEVVEESSEEMLTQCLPAHSNLPLKKAIERMGNIASGMQKDAMRTLEERNERMAQQIVQRDEEVDRFYHFIVRQLNLAVSNPLVLSSLEIANRQDCLSYIVVAKSIERAADHAVAISKLVSFGTKEKSSAHTYMKKAGLLSNELFEEALKAMLSSDAEAANEVITRTEEVIRLTDIISTKVSSTIGNPSLALSTRLVVESIKRIAEYAADMSEAVVNLSVAKPRMTWASQTL